MLKEFFKIRRYTRIPWKYFILGMIFMLFSALLNGVSLSSTVPLMDKIIAGKNIVVPGNLPGFFRVRLEPLIHIVNGLSAGALLKFLILFIIVAIFLKGLFAYLNNFFFHFFGNRLLTDLRNKLYLKVTNMSMDFFTQGHSGEMTSRIIYDVNLLMKAFTTHFPAIIFQGMLALVYLFIIFTIDWNLSLISLLIFPPLLLPIYRTGQRLRKLGKRIQTAYAQIGILIQEGFYGQQIIKSYNMEGRITERFSRENEKIFKSSISAAKRILLISPFTEFISVLGASGILYFGARKVIAGSLSSGFLFLFFIALFSIISPLKNIGNAYASLKHDSYALPRIFSVLGRQGRIKDSGREIFRGLTGSIEFRNVGFSYGGKIILKNISFRVARGEKLGIVGPTGVGKTTLAGLLLRFYEPESGEILMDGTDIRNFTLYSLREHIGLVTQEPILFNDTIRNNICLCDDVDTEKLERAVGNDCLRELIDSLPDGYETIVGERGTAFSGGQKQFLSIARVLYKNPGILILDEATASLDSNSEKLVQQAMEKITEGRTVFIIAHRLSTLRNVDRIIVLKNGEIEEMGSHNELFEKKGTYYRLWQLQFSQ